MCIFEFTGKSGGPRHLHYDQNEWIYILEGEYALEMGEKRFHLGPGESVFIPRKISHAWACVSESPGKVLNVFQPAGKMEEFFREIARHGEAPPIHEVLSLQKLHQLFHDHGMDLVGPPLEADVSGRKGGSM
jgi:oxalate decarboxylase/phosphoglucose isomerase-like protein (cupin superfamily)